MRFARMRVTDPTVVLKAALRCVGSAALVLSSIIAECQQPKPIQKPAASPTSEAAVESHLGRAYDALRAEQYDIAAAEFRAALTLDPTLTLRARFPLGVALFESKKLVEARKEFDAVQRSSGALPNVAYYLGRVDLKELHYADAAKNLAVAIAKPPFPDTAYYLGYSFFKQGDIANAEKWLKEAQRVTPNDSRVTYQLGMLYRHQGREQEAKEILAVSAEQRRRNAAEAQLRFDCAKKLDVGPREEAHALCDQLYDDNDAEKLTRLGTIYGQHGDAEAAVKPLKRAAELSPQAPQMQYNLALAYFQLGRFEDARGPLRDAVTHWPDIFQLASLYGAVLMKLNEEDTAYEMLGHAHRLNAQDSATQDMLFLATLSMGRKAQAGQRYPDAIRYFMEAAKLKPQEPSPHVGLSETYELSGRAALAKEEAQKAESLTKAFEQRH